MQERTIVGQTVAMIMPRPVAYVINLARRPDRWKRAQELWTPFFALERFEAIEKPDGAAGCKASHCTLAVQKLIRRQYCIVIEDDAMPSPAFERAGMDYIAEIARHPYDFDWINCGPFLDLSLIGLPKAELQNTVSPMFLRATYSHNTHFCIYNHRSLGLLAESLHSRLPVDMYLGRHSKQQWVPRELLATQPEGDSDIQRHQFPTNALYERTRQMLEEATASASITP